MINFVKQDEKWAAKAKEVFDLQQQRKLWEEKEAMALTELKEMTGDLNSFGGGYKYECSIRMGSIDYKAIPQLKGVNVDLYRKPTVAIWKLTFIGDIAQ